uniref:Putative CMP/dCMP deaminase zinc-binding n=1 Tax=viral metagenome TaxID=1070528 RepID=A0A6M3LBI4_9ZZZZ
MEEHRSQHEWDIQFMKEAKLWMGMSKCLSRKIGTVLVQGRSVIATGYNGPPSGVPHCDHRDDKGNYTYAFVSDDCPRRRMGFPSGEGMEHCVAVHAEINPIMQAAREARSTVGATLYCYCGTPCINCMKEIIQAGIKRIVCLGKSGEVPYIRSMDKPLIKDGDNATKKDYNFPLSEQICKIAGVKLDVITEDEIDG